MARRWVSEVIRDDMISPVVKRRGTAAQPPRKDNQEMIECQEKNVTLTPTWDGAIPQVNEHMSHNVLILVSPTR